MTTIATDGKSMAGDGQAQDHCDTIVDDSRQKVHRLSDGRIVGSAGNCFDAASWREWLEAGKTGACPVESERFAGLILHPDGAVYWVDHKGRETLAPSPCAVGSGQDLAIGAMEAGATPEQAISIAIRRDIYSGGKVTVLHIDPPIRAVA